MRIIKRYSNRRLYDTEESRTLTQADLAALIKDGVELKVVDSATGEDITIAVLGRILTAEIPAWKSARQSKELLSKMISLGGEKTMSILKDTILASFGAFQVTKDKAEKIIDELIKKGELDKSERKKAVLEMLEKAEKSTAKWREKLAAEAGKAHKEIASAVKNLNLAKERDLKKLNEKVDKLTKAMKKIEEKLNSL